MQKIYKNCLRKITKAFISALVKQIYRDTNILSRVGAVWPSWLRERQDPRGQGFESPPEQSFAKMQTLVLAEPRDYTAESVLAPTQGSLRKS